MGLFTWLSAILAAHCLTHVNGYATFRDEIPNGDNVPHPCDPVNALWRGVGHLSQAGGGARNPFGRDFDIANRQWTVELCRKDSDGDGRTNGEELGDPDCVWSKGGTPSVTARAQLSHPGICEPQTSDTCKRLQNVIPDLCANMDFQCAVVNETGTIAHKVNIPQLDVPAEETTYMCMRFEFPSRTDANANEGYHLVAMLEDIVNEDVMHHIVIYGCVSEEEDQDKLNTPYNCFMGGENEECSTFLGIWALGQNGYCFHPNVGIRVGNRGYKQAVMELHWNNPEKRSTYVDSSGMTFYLTPNMRQHDAGIGAIGGLYLEISPEEKAVSQKGVCRPSCTNQRFTGPINIVSMFNHMHDLGSKIVSEVVRSNNRVEYIGYDETYDYNRPVVHQFADPIQVQPGEQLEVKCTFNSMSRSKTTYWGFSTQAEMCFGFFVYYPIDNFIGDKTCYSYMDFDQCERREDVLRGCDTEKLFNATLPENIERYNNLSQNCAIGYCKKECKDVIRSTKEHACFQDELLRYFRHFSEFEPDNPDNFFTQRFYALLSSCDREFYMEEVMAHRETSGAMARGYSGGFSALALVGLVAWMAVYFTS